MLPIVHGANSRSVWDRFVRSFHWALVCCVLLNYFVLEAGEEPHKWIGTIASALVMARVLWGFVGSGYARFVDFLPTPMRLRRHIQSLRAGESDHHWGHNPLGALMMLLLMGLVLSLGATGWLQNTDTYFGQQWLQELHAWLGHGLMVAAGLHAVAAIVMGRLQRTRLVKAMLTGVKERY